MMKPGIICKAFTSKGVITLFALVPFFLAVLLSCNRSGITDEALPMSTVLVLRFEQKVDTIPFSLDNRTFENASGDLYKVTDLQYFVSDFTLHKNNGTKYILAQDNGIHYVDARMPETSLWSLNKNVPEGTFDSISFTFGISAEKNISNLFPNPPERDMNWPQVLGGGYHYIKMNLLWNKTGMDTMKPFNFHIGIGQIYKGNVINPDSITGYVQNFFTVSLPGSAFSIKEGQVKYIVISMNINKWFFGDNNFDFANYPNMMMQNQTAMHNACMNGKCAFTVRFNSVGK